jgi:gluconolactonase
VFTKSIGILFTALVCLGAIVVLGQAPAPAPAAGAAAAPQQGPGVQAPADARYQDWVTKNCKVPPPPRGGGGGRGAAQGAAPGQAAAPAQGAAAGGGGGRGANDPAAGPPQHREYAVKGIPGVVAEGQRWKSIWTGTGNNADGIIATDDGGILAAQNTNSAVLKLDRNGRASTPYKDTNTGGALSMNKKGAIFFVSRGLPASVWQLTPKRQILANMYNGEPLDCIGGTINDLTADSKGGVYFTMGGLFYANPKGVVTRYGEMLQTNGLVLSADEKTLYVTTRGVVAFDVQPDGSLTNQRQFYSAAGGDGTIIDSAGRVYTTSNGADGVAVLSPDGKLLGMIPTPLNFITVAFSGPDKKTLYGVANNQRFDEIFTLQMIAQGYKGRAK